ncbi:uncharacterized protein [Rutidosis leptorrhynchoides]|uniref:uncharacterized protein isoform X1 n=1 Tax=Rutidosis leptorrhynchoides TaxID=125765 RepID=UPI003A9A1D24
MKRLGYLGNGSGNLHDNILSNYRSAFTYVKVVPQLSCPIALFTYYKSIRKCGVEQSIVTVNEVGVHGRSYASEELGIYNPYYKLALLICNSYSIKTLSSRVTVHILLLIDMS